MENSQNQNQFMGMESQTQSSAPQGNSEFGQMNGAPQPNNLIAPTGGQGRKRKGIIIGALVAAFIILSGAVGYGVYAFMNSTQANAANVLDKIAKAQKAEGDVSAEAEIEATELTGGYPSSSGGYYAFTTSNQIKVKVKMDGNYDFSRKAESGNYFNLSGNVKVDGEGDSIVKSLIEEFNEKGQFQAKLTKDMKFIWSGFGQSGSEKVTGESKDQLEKILSGTESQEQKDMKELQKFLLEGYQPKMKTEGKVITFTFDKDELKKIAEKMQNNVRANKGKFEELLKKAKMTNQHDIDEATKFFAEGTLVYQLENTIFPKMTDFNATITYEDKGNQVKQTTNLTIGVNVQANADIKMKMTYKANTTYTI